MLRYIFWHSLGMGQIFWHSLGMGILDVLVTPSRGPPKWTHQKSIFFTAQLRVPVFYDIRRYLTDKYFESSFLEVP